MTDNLLPFEKIKREILVKKEAVTSPEHGCDPEKRPVSELVNYGIINLNKPKGPTSHQVSEYVQRILNISKAGHAGTLDPAVTGVLPTALGKATRIVQTLLPAGKEYVGIMHLHKPAPLEELKKVLEEFVGKITQLPPIKSAVKRELRERNVYYIEIIEAEEKDILFRIGCQAGTYIRKFCHDVGKRLGTGAHMSQLMRTKAGPFSDKEMITLQDIADAYAYWKKENNEAFIRRCIKPIEHGITHIPKVWIMDNAVDSVCHGAALNVPGIIKTNSGIKQKDIIAIMTLKEELVALGNAEMSTEEIMQEQHGKAASIFKVFMDPGMYPKYKK